MTTTTALPERLAKLEQITLDNGAHNNFDQGHCAMEVVSWLAGEGFTDAPSCASRVLRRYTIALNDRRDDEQRQALKPYLVRMIGTGSDGKDDLREAIAAQYLADKLLEPWLRLAGMNDEADQLAELRGADKATRRAKLRSIRDAAWALRSKNWKVLRDTIEAKVRERLVAADAVADADAVAVAVAAAAADAAAVAVPDAAAAAVADAAAIADAAADAAADAVAVAVADAAAVAAAAAVADAAADAVAVAAAAAVADAAADLSYGSDGYWKVRNAAYQAARKHFEDNRMPVIDQAKEIAASQQSIALELLDAMIDPQAVTA